MILVGGDWLVVIGVRCGAGKKGLLFVIPGLLLVLVIGNL